MLTDRRERGPGRSTPRRRTVPLSLLVAVGPMLITAASPGAARAQDDDGPDVRAPEPADSSAALYGTVTVAGTGEPLSHAAIRLVDRGRVTVADSAGAYRFRNLRPGEVTVRVSYLGARAEDRPVTLEAGDAERVDVTADRVAVELAELQVDVERARRGKMAGFEERKERGRGDYITREDFERLNPIRTTQVIRHASVGARIEFVGRGEYRVLLGHGPRRCSPAVFLDGALVPNFSVNDIHPSDIEAIEIYDGPAETPARFKTLQPCGAVVVWLRSGP